MMKVMQTRPVPEMQATGTKIDKSRMMGDYQVRFCERVRLKCRALLDHTISTFEKAKRLLTGKIMIILWVPFLLRQ